MKVSMEWLQDFVPIELPVKTFCDGMTLSGSKVESYDVQGQEISRVVTGRIVSIEKHPDADKLVVCQVDIGSETIQIVTAAPNVQAGALVPVALNGSSLVNGVKIKSGKLRGVLSDGMMCSIQELGYTTAEFPDAAADGIYLLPADTAPGQDIGDVLGIRDTVVDFEITSNRMDCFAVEGLGREAAVTFNLPFTARAPVVRATDPTPAEKLAAVRIEAPDLCYRYCGRVVREVVIKASPAWLKRRLRAAGVRPINNLVDITNYVMLELGQPMHAFDLDQLAGQQIIVRRAGEQEIIRTLDSVDRPLDSQMLVIADASRVVALAGVMGAENSEITTQTRTVLLEAATFNAFAVRRAAKKVGLRTEASSRFEKGLDVYNAERAMNRACELIEQLGCGRICQGLIDVWPYRPEPRKLTVKPAAINRFLGTAIVPAEMKDILERLGCQVTDRVAGVAETWSVLVPSWRPDLEGEADLSEEVARIYGYNKIEPSLLSGKATTLGGRTPAQRTVEQIKDILAAWGYFEACTYSFESPRQLDRLLLPAGHELRRAIVITNPLGEDYSVMRTSMVPAMLSMAALNSSRSVQAGSLYEIAFTYQPKALPLTELPDEIRHLSVIRFDEITRQDKGDNFFAVKGLVEELMIHLGLSALRFVRAEGKPWLHPGRSADIYLGQKWIGSIGVVHPDVADRFEAPASSVLLDIALDTLLPEVKTTRVYQALPKFPAVTRDLALICDQPVLVADLIQLIQDKGGRYLESVGLFDVYEGHQVQTGKKSVAFNLVFRSAEKTLSDDDIQPAINQILQVLKDFGADLRD